MPLLRSTSPTSAMMPTWRQDSIEAGAVVGSSSGKLWNTTQFPEGIRGANNWDLQNLEAAQAWQSAHAPIL
jgi:hypothetical protein